MFWQYGISPSTLDQLFENEDRPTVQEVLAEQDLLQELKSHNEKVVEFFTEEDNIKTLIDFILSKGIKEENKLSGIATEVLTTGVTSIDNAFFEDPNNFKILWSIIKEYENYGISTLSRVVRLLTHYCTFRVKEVYIFFKEYDINFMSDLLGLIEHPIISDLIIRMLFNKLDEEGTIQFQEAFTNSNVVQKLIQLVSLTSTPEKACGAASLTIELIRSVRSGPHMEDLQSFEQHFMESMLSDEILEVLVDNIKACYNVKEEIAMHGATILSAVFNLQRCGYIYGEEFQVPNCLPQRYVALQKQDFSHFYKKVEILVDMLKEEPKKNWLNTAGRTGLCFGMTRLYVLESVVSLMLHNNETIASELLKNDICHVLMDIIENYPDNNLCHSLIELGLSSILQGVRWKSNTSTLLHVDNILVSSLFDDDYFIKKLIEFSHKKSGYSGHIHEIQRIIRKCLTDSYHKDIIVAKISALPQELISLFHEMQLKLQKLDEIESIDKQFVLSFTSDFESNDDMNFSRNANSQYISLDKGLKSIKLSKSSLIMEDNIEKIENEMEPDIDTLVKNDYFTDMRIEHSDISYQLENVEHINEIVDENINDLVLSLKVHLAESDDGSDTSEENIVAPTNQEDDKTKDLSKQNISISVQEYSGEECLKLDNGPKYNSTNEQLTSKNSLNSETTRLATSSPISCDSSLTSIGDDEAFQNDEIANNNQEAIE